MEKKTSTKEYTRALGRRKTATAVVKLYPSSKNSYTINGKDIKVYFPTADLQKIVFDALTAVEGTAKYDVVVTTSSNQESKKQINTIPSYEIFKKTIKRAKNLIEIHKDGGDCLEHHLDSFRASIVLSISALDAYTRTLVVEKIIVKLTNQEKLPEQLVKHIKKLLDQDALLDAGRKGQFKDIVENAIRKDFETKSFQGENRIVFYMELAGIKDVFEKISHSANVNENRLRADIEKFTKRRHIIAHCGDYDLTQVPVISIENSIDKIYSQDCIKVVELFAEHLNKVTTK